MGRAVGSDDSADLTPRVTFDNLGDGEGYELVQDGSSLVERFAEELLGRRGRVIGGKYLYEQEHPDHFVVFNARVFIGGREVWAGDLDVTEEVEDRLASLSRKLSYNVVLLKENANPNSPDEQSVLITYGPKGEYDINEDLVQLDEDCNPHWRGR